MIYICICTSIHIYIRDVLPKNWSSSVAILPRVSSTAWELSRALPAKEVCIYDL